MRVLTRLLYLCLALGLGANLLFSCKGKDGDPGPQGDAGAVGVQGQPGDRPDSRIKEGFVKGTITGFRRDGVTPLNETFAYEFYERTHTKFNNSVRETNTPNVYEFVLSRGDSLGVDGFELRFRAPLSLSTDTATALSFFYSKDLPNNQVLGVNGSFERVRGKSPAVRLSNLSYNRSSGLLTGNITWDAIPQYVSSENTSYYCYTGSGSPFQVNASFSVRATLFSSFRTGTRAD